MLMGRLYLHALTVQRINLIYNLGHECGVRIFLVALRAVLFAVWCVHIMEKESKLIIFTYWYLQSA